MTMNSDAKFEEKPICFKNDKNLMNIDLSTQKSQNLHFDWSFRANYILFHLKRTEKLSFMTLMSHAKFEEKLTCALENDMRNLANFHQNP